MESGFHPPVRALKLVEPPPPPPARCLDCDQELAGKFCHHCGQAAKTKRFTFHDFLHEVPHALIHLDHTLLHTLKALLTRPGETIRAYLDGKRTKIYSPVALFFLLAGIVAVVQLTKEAAHVQGGADTLLTIGSHKISVLESIRAGSAFMKDKRAFLQVLGTPVYALFPWLILRRRTKLGFAEQTMAATMISTGMAAIGVVFVPAIWLLRNHAKVQGIVGGVQGAFMYAYCVWAYAGLQEHQPQETAAEKRARWFRGLLAAIGNIAGGMSLLAMLMVIAITSLVATTLVYAALAGVLHD